MVEIDPHGDGNEKCAQYRGADRSARPDFRVLGKRAAAVTAQARASLYSPCHRVFLPVHLAEQDREAVPEPGQRFGLGLGRPVRQTSQALLHGLCRLGEPGRPARPREGQRDVPDWTESRAFDWWWAAGGVEGRQAFLGARIGDAGTVQGAEQPVPEVAGVSGGWDADDFGFQPAVLVVVQGRGHCLDEAGSGPRGRIDPQYLPVPGAQQRYQAESQRRWLPGSRGQQRRPRVSVAESPGEAIEDVGEGICGSSVSRVPPG